MKKLDPSLLSAIPPFSKLDRDQVAEILELATPFRFDEGTTVFSEGASAGRFFLLLDGYIRVVRITPHGDQVIALHIASGQLFGIAAALGRDTYPASAVAAAECMCLSWPMHHWEGFVADYPGFSTETYKIVGERVAEMNNRILEMATQMVEQRIANTLLRLINQTGRKVDAGIEIDFPITRQDVSEMTGSTLHTVSRLLSDWQRQGIVESKRRHIIVTDPHQLVVLSQS